MAQFFFRMIDWVANEIIVKHLANSRSFQRFAVKTDEAIQSHSKKASEIGGEVLKKASVHGEKIISDTSKKAASADLSGFSRFFNAFAEEVKKDVNKIAK